MRKSRFTEAQIVQILKAFDAGTPAAELCQQHSISKPTLYQWKAKYGGMETSQLQQLKAVNEENGRLKRMYAELSLVHHALKDVLEKNGYGLPGAGR
jgi:putative transposase